MVEQKTTLSESFNAGVDNLLAAANRLLELPLFILVPAFALLAWMATMWLYRRSRLSTSPHARNALLAIYGVLALAAISFVADRRVQRLNDRVAQLQATSARLAARNFSQSPVAPPSGPAAAPASTRSLHFDAGAATAYLKSKFPGLTFESRPYNDAADYVQLHGRGGFPIEAYLVVIDLTRPGVRVKLAANLSEKTYTSDFARANACSIAINGEAGQSPGPYSGLGTWSGNMVLDGKPLLKETAGNPRPFLSFDQAGHATFTTMSARGRTPPADAYNVIWGRFDAVTAGVVQTADERNRQPRTAMGVDKTGNLLFLLVADGRQPSYSMGLTRAEVGHILAAFGANDGMLCDEGGSSCLYLDQIPGIANAPSDNSERATYTHFGVAFEAAPGR